MLVSRISSDVTPAIWNKLKKSTVNKTHDGLSETFKNGYKLLTDFNKKNQTVVDPKGNVIIRQIVDSKSGKSYII